MARTKGTDADKKLAALMYQQRQHQDSIATFFNVSQSTISAWIREGSLLIERDMTIQNSQSQFLKMKLDMIEENYKQQITNLLEMARIMSISTDHFIHQKSLIDANHNKNISDLIEYNG